MDKRSFYGLGMGLILMGAIAGCGESRVEQCQKIIQALNAAGESLDSADRSEVTVTQLVEKADETLPHLEKLKLRDKTLKDLTQQLTDAAREFSEAGKELKTQLASEEELTIDKALESNEAERFQAANKRSQEVVDQIDRYCKEGKLTPES